MAAVWQTKRIGKYSLVLIVSAVIWILAFQYDFLGNQILYKNNTSNTNTSDTTTTSPTDQAVSPAPTPRPSPPPLHKCPYPKTDLGDTHLCGLNIRSLMTLEPCVVYSFGNSWTEPSFEQAILSKTVCTLVVIHFESVNSNWVPDLLEKQDVKFVMIDRGNEKVSLRRLMDRFNHTWIDILHLYIEDTTIYSIWKEILLNSSDSDVLPVGQLLLKLAADEEFEIYLEIKGFLMFYKFSVSSGVVKFGFYNVDQKRTRLDRGESLQVSPDKIVIGSASCDFDDQWNQTHPVTDDDESVAYNSATSKLLTMIKSVLISKQVYNVSAPMEFHLLLQNGPNVREFRRLFSSKFGAFLPKLNVNQSAVFFYSAVDFLPVYLHKMVFSRECRFLRVVVLLPDLLYHVDSIIYLEADFVITGNISRYWDQFANMNSSQFIGIASNAEASPFYDELFKNHFLGIPHVPPKGVNSGLLLMNLLKMRTTINSTGELQSLHSKNWTLPITHQRLINIYLHDHLERLYLLPCQFNFMYVHCDHGLTCSATLEDPDGILGIHGAGGNFNNPNGSLKQIYLTYQRFDMAADNFQTDLVAPLKGNYSHIEGFWKGLFSYSSKCYGSLNRVLFKRFL